MGQKKAQPSKSKSRVRKKVTKQPKPKSPTASWKEFEMLVSRIEKILSPRGAKVKSPDFIPDKITGELREVDASIKYKIGSVDILMTVECRERNKAQDTLWIEQLFTKQQNIGSAKTIAVSANGFTQPATQKAEMLGIELRILSRIKDENIAKLFSITRTEIKYKIKDFLIGIDTDNEQFEELKKFISEIKPNAIDCPICIINGHSSLLTIRQVFESLLHKARKNINEPEIPDEGETGIYKFQGIIPGDQIIVQALGKNFPLNRLTVDYTLYKHSEIEFDLSSAFKYSDTKNSIFEGLEYKAAITDNENEVLTMQIDASTGSTRIQIWKQSLDE